VARPVDENKTAADGKVIEQGAEFAAPAAGRVQADDGLGLRVGPGKLLPGDHRSVGQGQPADGRAHP